MLNKIESEMKGAKPEGAELCNCQKTEPEHIDFHLWLVAAPTNVNTPAVAKPDSIVVETTPRVRKNHPNWTVDRLTDIATNKTLVRVSGWLTFDQETSGTDWTPETQSLGNPSHHEVRIQGRQPVEASLN